MTTPRRQGLRIIQTLQPLKTKPMPQTGSRVCRSRSTVWGTLQAESLAANRRQLQHAEVVLPTMYTRQLLWPIKSGLKSVFVNLGCLAALLAVSGRVRKILMRHAYKALRFNSQPAAGFLVALVLQVSRFDLSSFEGILVISLVGDLLSY